ncbi:tetratricopeptide repeat protein [Argonema galeatum]|uniref:tetratricopeptide repeat protein n=1 Tax=Argonema galeatum TaxID=2942762 RepID=UPI002012CB1C|nr:tetratricopeptide repeat protein [Argonema galeatum]MCL1468208.1 ATP-binding protein [Argonema galeatum A003/A1]
MDFEEAIKVLDATVFAKKKLHLRDVELVILRGTWQDKRYHEIAKASGYTATYLQQDIGPKLWNLISEVLGEKVSKTNFQAPLERLWQASLRAEAQKPASSESSSGLEIEQTINNQNAIFLGREKAIADLNTMLDQRAKIILILGEGGIGKTLLCWEFLNSGRFDLILDLWMAKETENITSAKKEVEKWLRQHFNEEPGGDFGVTLERLRQKLREQTKKVAVLIDNLEPALDRDGKFIAAHRDYVELLRVLADPGINCITLITSRERLGESAVTFKHYKLEGLDLATWEQFFNSHKIKTDSIALKEALSAMHKAYKGNAKAMHIVSGVIEIDWECDLEAYWQINENDLLSESVLKDLVVTQFNRLKQIDPEAYKLLCRLGCYRYQDVRSVFLDGILYLLWDVPEEQRSQVVKSLRDRSLLDFYKGEYGLHPVIRAEAIARLRTSDEWETVNRQAAEFWTKSVETVENLEDALKALEAYYHYTYLNEFDLAAEIIIKERPPNSKNMEQKESLSHSFIRMGLVQNINSVITPIINKISNEYYLALIYGDFGGNYHRLGDLQNALKFYYASREKAIKCLSDELLLSKICKDENSKFELKRREIGILFAISACKVGLGETKEALKSYEETVENTLNTNLHVFAILSWFGQAVLYSNRESAEYDKQKAYQLLEKGEQAYKELPPTIKTLWWIAIYSSLWLGLVYSNSGENEKAFEMFSRVKVYAEENNSKHNKGHALNGLTGVYRNVNEFEKALENHAEAIKIFQGLGAKADLADAYYQLGLTYQKMGNIEDSNKKFAEAISLYEQIVAPKQIVKIQRAKLKNDYLNEDLAS